MNTKSRRVRKRRGFEETRLRRELGRRISRLIRKTTPPLTPDAKRADRYTTLDAQNAVEGEATRQGLEVDAGRSIAPLKKKYEGKLAKRRVLGRALRAAEAFLKHAQDRAERFEGRFGRAPELLASTGRWLSVLTLVFIAALLVPDYALNVPAFEFLAPATGASGFLAEHLDEWAALTFTAAQGVFAKFAGKHLAWAMSPLVACVGA